MQEKVDYDMEEREIRVGDEILVATRSSYIRRAIVTDISDYGWIKVQMVVSKRKTSVPARATFKL
ncbi:hypothetical protein UT300009_30090 [Paraclostridium bifermentans]